MSSLTVLVHPLSSCCHKLLIAMDVLGVSAELQLLNLGDPEARAAHLARWPTGKMPLLMDQGRPIPETSIIIEHLQLQHAAPGCRLIPEDPVAAIDVRLWDRLMDLYVMTPMQALTADLLRPPAERDPRTVAQAQSTLQMAYGMIDAQVAGRAWLCGSMFSLADCAAAPALFYAVTYVPLPPAATHLAGYFERLVAHPPVARVIDQARPWFKHYPGRAGLARRFWVPDEG